MTVAAQTPITNATGNGVTTAFSTAWKATQAGDVVVQVAGVTQTLTTHYSLTGLGGSTLTVTFVTAPASGAAVLIYRDTAVTRSTDYQVAGDFLAQTVNEDFDRPIRILQDMDSGMKTSPRVMRAPVGETLDDLPGAASRAGGILAFDAFGQAEVVYPDELQATISGAYTQSQTSAVATSGQTVFSTPTYVPGAASSRVFVNGLRMQLGSDYLESGANEVTMLAPLVAGDEVVIETGRQATVGSIDADAMGYTPPGGVARSVASALSDRRSVMDHNPATDGVTSSQTAIAAAVAAAYAAGDDLYWPDYDFVSTASIPNLHSVRHRGPGRIKRGVATFYVEPRGSQSNTLNVAASGGSSTNDGLGTSQAMDTFQAAFTALANYGPMLDGRWTVSAAAGIYDFSAGTQVFSVPSRNRVVIKGPAAGHPNVPTCIIDGGGITANYLQGLYVTGSGVYVTVQDIKAQNFQSPNNTRVGFLFDSNCDAYTNNLHAHGCSWAGIMFKELAAGRVQGGILDGNSTGAYGFISDSTRSSFGYGASGLSTGPVVQNCLSAGVYWSTGSQGHCDWTNFLDNSTGFYIAENSRADTVGDDFKRNATGIRAITGGFWSSGGADVTFGTGADANTTDIEAKAYSGAISELDDQASGSWQRVAVDRTGRSASGVTSGDFPVIYTIAANRLRGVHKACKVEASGVYIMNAASSLTLKLGGFAVNMVVPAAAAGSTMFTLSAEMQEVQGGYRIFVKLEQSMGGSRMTMAAGGFTNTADQDINIAYNLTNAGDALNIYRTNVYLIG